MQLKVNDLRDRITFAQAEGVPYVEAEQDVIEYLNPQGLGGAKYFCLNGMKVFPAGQAEQILKDEERPLEQRIHPNGF